MSWRRIWIIFRKELVDILRDRRTLLSMLVVPILAVPLLMWLANTFVSKGIQGLKEDSSVIAVIGREEGGSMVELLDLLDEIAGDPAALGKIDDPLLSSALNYMMRPDEAFDALLASQQSEPDAASEADLLGDARFVDVTDFSSELTEVEALVRGRSFLGDPVRTRLLESMDHLDALDASGDEIDDSDLALLADRRRLEAMNPTARAEAEEQLTLYRQLKTDTIAGIAADRYDAVVIFHDDFSKALANENTARYTILYDESADKSSIARQKVSGFLDRLNNGLVRARVSHRQLQATLLDPIVPQELKVGRKRNFLALFLPYIVLLMCFAGALYPAIDLAAGEKERGTLETLLVTPAARSELVFGKFLVVSLTAVVAAILNIASLVVATKTGLLSLGGAGASLTLEPQAVALSVLLLIPVGTFFAAVLLATSIFARSYKEAQSYVVPINMAIILPALSSMIPGIQLNPKLALIPLVNVALALKEAWSGVFQWESITIILVSSAVYAGIALFVCTKWFQREEVLFRS